ncbi:hypothetical protein SAMN04488490_3147 [Marinobacter sp. LV10R510-11A]|nr:hypothetical protein SAMN04488490_3147 [Marinobacter sp. LV10R510-11A]
MWITLLKTFVRRAGQAHENPVISVFNNAKNNGEDGFSPVHVAHVFLFVTVSG